MITNETRESQALILNTFEDLEAPILCPLRTRYAKIYTIGPLHELLKTKLRSIKKQESYSSLNPLWEVDRTCITWLDNQASHSVLYVSFGSIAIMTREQLMEFWYGVENSKKKFLWVIRPNSVTTNDDGVEEIPEELQEGPKERGYIVKWAPQEEVLAHKAIGGFLTHSGWNSTLESIVAGVPMICWPCFGDQQMNSRFVSEVWKLGMDMKDVCDRKVVQKMVNDLMVDRREEFVKSTARMAELARKSVTEVDMDKIRFNVVLVEEMLCPVLIPVPENLGPISKTLMSPSGTPLSEGNQPPAVDFELAMITKQVTLLFSNPLSLDELETVLSSTARVSSSENNLPSPLEPNSNEIRRNDTGPKHFLAHSPLESNKQRGKGRVVVDHWDLYPKLTSNGKVKQSTCKPLTVSDEDIRRVNSKHLATLPSHQPIQLIKEVSLTLEVGRNLGFD
ncbi:hypothetical protein GH714_012381 [Hevea brasiliensis]|uniref:Glycosyltransferase n=1 Tax=Hevea brasiliensis TaxID=3981 RepID=A0A6A6N4B9_HEVBR|nr:hypothetical protein GH714_012381 [Hevea brasiliensis]